MLVHILALPLTVGDLGEVILYQLGYFQKPPSSLLESSGNLLFYKFRGRAGSELVTSEAQGLSVSLLCQTPCWHPISFLAPSSS